MTADTHGGGTPSSALGLSQLMRLGWLNLRVFSGHACLPPPSLPYRLPRVPAPRSPVAAQPTPTTLAALTATVRSLPLPACGLVAAAWLLLPTVFLGHSDEAGG